MPVWNGTVPSFSAGETPTAAKLQTLADIAAAISGPWTGYTPTIKFGGTAWTLGNATVQFTYRRIGKACDVAGRVVVGSTTNFNGGSGALVVSLPVSSARGGGSPWPIGDAFTTDASPLANYLWTAYLNSATEIAFINSTGLSSNTFPFTWTTGDELRFQGTYEAA